MARLEITAYLQTINISITISESDESVNFTVVSAGPFPPRPAAFSNFVTEILQLTL